MMNSLMRADEMEVDDPNSVIICRLCAEVTSPKSFIPLYTDDKREQPVVKQINRLVSNLISPNDGLPQDVCLRCAENVGKFYAFVASIIETQNKLRRIMQLPEIKDIESGEESQHISFLNDDNTSPYALTHADDGPEILASRDTNIRLNGNSKFSPSKGNKAKTEDRALGNADPSKNRFFMKRIPDNEAAADVHPMSRPIRLYRCGACDARFQSREECILHIAQTHKDMQKEASKNTIFVKLPTAANSDRSSGSFETSQEPRPPTSSSLRFSTSVNKAFSSFKSTTGSQSTASTSAKQLNEVVRNASNKPLQPPKQSISSTSTPNHLPQTSTCATKSAAPSRPAPQTPSAAVSQQSAKISAAAPATTEPKDEVKRPRHRKVLAIDGFFKEVTKKVTRYICDVCGRAMTSQFAFIRHLHEHDWSDDEIEEDEKSKRKSLPPVPRPKPGYCSPCKIRVPNSVRHKMFHAISDLEKAHPNHVHLLAAASEHVKSTLLGMQDVSSGETSAPSVFHDVDDFVELLVVDPDMVEMDMQDILKGDSLILNDRSQAVVVSSADETIICVKEDDLKEEHDLTEEEIENSVIEQANETMFLENYEIGEAMIDLPGLTDPDSAILFKCSNCEQTFDSEKTFQAHYCVIGDDAKASNETFHEFTVDTPESNVRIREYHCNVCNRSFKSAFLFRLHAAQHKTTTLCVVCNCYFPDSDTLFKHTREKHPNRSALLAVVDESVGSGEKQCDVCDVCGKITDNLKQHEMYHTIKELEHCKEKNKKFLKKWFFCHKCNKKIFSEANYLFHVAKHQGSDTVNCRQCDFVASNIQDYNMHITSHTGGKYFICNDCDKCFFTRSAISDHVLIHMEGTRYMCEICGKRFKTSRSNAQHKLLQHKKYFRCNRCNRGFTHEAKLNSHYNICQVINQEQNDSKVFETVERFFCNICNSNIKSSSEISILFHRAKHDGKDGVECKFCHFMCKNACIYKNHLLIHTNQRPFACSQCTKSFRTKGCLVQHMLVHGNEYKYTCEYCGKKSKKLTTHVNHVNIHTDTKPYKCPDCDRPFRQLSDMKKHRRTHLKYKPEPVTITELPYLTIKTEVEDMMAAENIQHLQLA